MVMHKGANQFLTIEEYFAIEEKSQIKHHYLNGKLQQVPGGTPNHNLIAGRVVTELNNALDQKTDKEYFVFNSDMKIDIPKFNHVVYPDAVVVCEKIILREDRNDVIINPLLIVEVLSPSTENYDRTTKFHEYKTIPYFKEYVLIEQSTPRVNSFFRKEPNLWEDNTAEGLDKSIYLKSIDVSISLKKLYKGVSFL